MTMTTAGPPGSEPKGDEQRAIDSIVDATIDRCTHEGLTATSLQDRTFLTCPALVAAKPSWIIAPIGHPEVVDDVKKLLDETPRTP